MSTFNGTRAGIVLMTGTQTNPVTIKTAAYVTKYGGGDGVYGDSGTAWNIANNGTIVAQPSGSGVDLRGGGSVTNASVGVISGHNNGVEIFGAVGTVANLGTIVGTGDAAVFLGAGGCVTNGQSGSSLGLMIGTDGVSIENAVGTVTNFGTITSFVQDGVFFGFGGTLYNNQAAARISGYDGVYASKTATIANLGTIAGGHYGIKLKAGGSVTNVQSGAQISGGTEGIGVFTQPGTIVNFGTITGTVATGVYLAGGGSVTNGQSGSPLALISAGVSGVAVNGAAGTVMNFATISGGSDGVGVSLVAGGSVTNGASGSTAALISSGFVGVSISNVTATVSNFGTIFGGGYAAVSFTAGGTLVNARSAVVSGNTLGVSAGTAAVTLINSGTISGGVRAVQFGAGTDWLIVDPEAVFNGAVDGRDGFDTLELRSGAPAGTLSELNTEFVNFERITVDPGANWSIDAAALPVGQIVQASGGTSKLVLLNPGTIDLSGVSGFPTIQLADGGANSTTLHTLNFVGLTGSVITVRGGGAGNAIEASGLSAAERVVLNGGAGADTLTGGAGSDWLNGGGGADIMAGGAGNDTYVVNNAGDAVSEASGGGTDTVATTTRRCTLGANVEKLKFIGSGNFVGIGNSLNNTLTGGAGDDWLNGGPGNDTMAGSVGDDTYIVNSAGDTVTEAASAGTDTIETTLARYTLPADVENLTFIGSGNFIGLGNSLDNAISGGAGSDWLNAGAGNDRIDGGAGNDTLTGGAGQDAFVFDTALNATTNVDRVHDFTVAADQMLLRRTVFANASAAGGGAGALDPAQFFIFGGGGSETAGSRIIYNSSNGAVSYDPDGTGAASLTRFALLPAHLALASTNFTVF